MINDNGVHGRVHPETLAITPLDSLSELGSGNTARGIVAIASSNSLVPFDATALYGIDSLNDTLVRISESGSFGSPDVGVVSTVGPLGVNADDFAGRCDRDRRRAFRFDRD